MSNLRNELTRITSSVLIKDQTDEIDKIRSKYSHQINFISPPESVNNCNCFEFALGLYQENEYMVLKTQLEKDGYHIVFCKFLFHDMAN